MGSTKDFWKKLYRILPKKQIYIEGNAAEELGLEDVEILEGEVTPVKVYFDETCEYEVVEREIKPIKLKCPACRRTVLYGMDYCNFCGAVLKED